MAGKNSGLVSRIKIVALKNTLHCIIHQRVLCAKLSGELKEVMEKTMSYKVGISDFRISLFISLFFVVLIVGTTQYFLLDPWIDNFGIQSWAGLRVSAGRMLMITGV